MPIIWRSFIRSFLSLFLLVLTLIIFLLLLFRLHDIISLIAISASPIIIGKFIASLIPYSLPQAIPIAALITAYVLSERLSEKSEWVALRTLGFKKSTLLLPFCFLGLFLSLSALILLGEICPKMRETSRKLIHKAFTSNPLLLFQNDRFIPTKDSICLANESSSQGEHQLDNLFFIYKEPRSGYLQMLVIDHLRMDQHFDIQGFNVASISHHKEHLVLDQEKEVFVSISHLIPPFIPDLNAEEYLPFMKIQTTKELFRRLMLSCYPLLFTLLGVVYGMSIGKRQRSKAPLISILALASLSFVCYFSGRATNQWLLYLIPAVILPIAIFKKAKEN